MLSPPYSPFPEKEVASRAMAAAAAATPAAAAGPFDQARVLAGRSNSDSATAVSSGSVISDEFTENDYSSEESSGSVPPEEGLGSELSGAAAPSRARKRAASEAFLGVEAHANGARSRSLRQPRMTTCWDALKSNPAQYLRLERSLLELYPLRRHSWAGPSSSMGSGASSDSLDGAGAASTPRGRGRRAQRAGSTNGSVPGGPGRRGRRSALQVDGDAGDDAGDDQSPKKGTPVRVHDLSLHQIEDYSPPLSSLPPGKSLRAEWKGAPMDLSNDPELHLLHPAEAHLASVLRLPCEVYLDSKRRLFAEKVHRLRQGLPFRRTDSQKACRIDVNKASRLFGAFERIGWLDDALFQKHLE